MVFVDIHYHAVVPVDLAYRHLHKYLDDSIVRDLNTSASVQAELEREWEQLVEDRNDAREIFPTGNSKVTQCMC